SLATDCIARFMSDQVGRRSLFDRGQLSRGDLTACVGRGGHPHFLQKTSACAGFADQVYGKQLADLPRFEALLTLDHRRRESDRRKDRETEHIELAGLTSCSELRAQRRLTLQKIQLGARFLDAGDNVSIAEP